MLVIKPYFKIFNTPYSYEFAFPSKYATFPGILPGISKISRLSSWRSSGWKAKILLGCNTLNGFTLDIMSKLILNVKVNAVNVIKFNINNSNTIEEVKFIMSKGCGPVDSSRGEDR